MNKQYVLLYPITESEFHFSLDELREAIAEAGASSYLAGDSLFIMSTNPRIVENIRNEHNINGIILGADEIIA